jgi:hypothetical protein
MGVCDAAAVALGAEVALAAGDALAATLAEGLVVAGVAAAGTHALRRRSATTSVVLMRPSSTRWPAPR